MDDLSPTAITLDGRLRPENDHGYGVDHKDGLFAYLDEYLFRPFPEIKGTFFLLTDRHTNHKDGVGGRKVLWRGFDEAFVSFLKQLEDRFDHAFHGVHHLHYDSEGRRRMEFADRRLSDLEDLKEAIRGFSQRTGIEFQGVKLPGYVSNDESSDLIKKLGFRWWVYSAAMMDKDQDNDAFFDGPLLKIPSNLNGNAFAKTVDGGGSGFPPFFHRQWKRWERKRKERYLESLYQKGFPITVQEHYSTARSIGGRQDPNLFDDLASLSRIFSFLRGGDIWHTGMNALAKYIENRDQSELVEENRGFRIIYQGTYPDPAITVRCNSVDSIRNGNGEWIHGVRKGGGWVFDGLVPGSYSFE